MKTDNIVESLQRYGIRAAEYKRPPIGKDVFALTIRPTHKEGVVTINQGNAKVDVTGSKQLRQAAITVREYGRKVTKRMRWVTYQDTRPNEQQILDYLKRRFPVIMPRGSTWSIADIEVKRHRSKPVYRGQIGSVYWDVRARVTAEVKQKTTNHFLLGMDETRNFISPLSRHVKSVREAHQLLKPKRIKKGTKRQGEWFLIPCGKAKSKELDELVAKTPGVIHATRLGSTTHTAHQVVRDGGTYARGYITDRRKGHHAPILLTKWHKVVKNREATIKVADFQRHALANRRRTWD